MDLEKELRDAQAALATAKSEEASLRTKANELVEEKKRQGADLLGDEAVFNEIDEAFKHADGKAADVATLNARVVKALGWVGEKAQGPSFSVDANEARTLSARLLEDDGFKAFQSVIERTGLEGARFQPVEVAKRDELIEGLRLNTTVDNSSGSGGGLIWSDRKDIVVPMAQRRVRILDIIQVGTTNSDTVEYARETTHTDAAAGTPYGTALPEAAYGWTKDSTTVKRIGHFVPATEGALMDAGQLDTLLRGNLQSGVLRETERQVYAGAGTNDLVGITDSSRSNVQTQAVGAETYGKYWHAIHKAITKIRVANLDGTNDPTAIVINPLAWEEICLSQDANGNYINAGRDSEPTSVWGLPVVVSNLAPSGTALVGDFSQAVLWVRSGVAVSSTDSHSDWFLKGLVALKADYRAAFAVLQEKAFVKVTGY